LRGLSLALLTTLQAAVWASSERVSGLVTYVADGDTVYVRMQERQEQQAVRLLGIDAPEICQDGGPRARQVLHELVHDQRVDLELQGQDTYGRLLARVFSQGRDIGREMVRQGQAWSHAHNGSAAYGAEQEQARAARRGLFAQPSPEPPYRFRRRHGSCKVGP